MSGNDLRCPNCGATRDNLRLVYVVEASHGIEADSSGEIVVNMGHNGQPPGGSTPGLACDDCGNRWPLPQGISVAVRKEDGQKVRIFGPDGKAR